jgi:hypothetical protein
MKEIGLGVWDDMDWRDGTGKIKQEGLERRERIGWKRGTGHEGRDERAA